MKILTWVVLPLSIKRQTKTNNTVGVTPITNFSALSWLEQVTYDINEMMSAL
jgi:hypothetical protein